MYGNRCCFATTTNSALLGIGVKTCVTTVPTAAAEYAAATCDVGFYLKDGNCERVCSGTADAASYLANGGNKCCSKDKDTTLKGKGVNTCTAVDPT